MMSVYIILCMTFLYITWVPLIEGKTHNNYYIADSHYPPPPPPPITYDNLGNCYVDAVNLRGQCVRYQQCLSAVQNWQYYRRLPFSCFYNDYDNFVCCPEAYITALTPPQVINPPRLNPSVPGPGTPTIPLPPEQRRSELECSSMYNQSSKKSHRHHKRSTNATNSAETTNDEVQEEIIEKVHVKQTEIVGGRLTYRNEFPYMCALGWQKSSDKHADTTYSCGCVLIARKYALTAAHCAMLGGEAPSVVRLGGVDLDERQAEMIKIQRITPHPEYDSKLAYNDIAVIKLKKSSRETPACLWPNEGLPEQQLTALGYGQTKFAGPSTNNLLKVNLYVLTNEHCNSFYKPADKLVNGVEAGQICAGDPQGQLDTCQGDSGGPLLMKVDKYGTSVPYIVGLTSFGQDCASGIPSVYTRISHFIEWIESEVGIRN